MCAGLLLNGLGNCAALVGGLMLMMQNIRSGEIAFLHSAFCITFKLEFEKWPPLFFMSVLHTCSSIVYVHICRSLYFWLTNHSISHLDYSIKYWLQKNKRKRIIVCLITLTFSSALVDCQTMIKWRKIFYEICWNL